MEKKALSVFEQAIELLTCTINWFIKVDQQKKCKNYHNSPEIVFIIDLNINFTVFCIPDLIFWSKVIHQFENTMLVYV